MLFVADLFDGCGDCYLPVAFYLHVVTWVRCLLLPGLLPLDSSSTCDCRLWICAFHLVRCIRISFCAVLGLFYALRCLEYLSAADTCRVAVPAFLACLFCGCLPRSTDGFCLGVRVVCRSILVSTLRFWVVDAAWLLRVSMLYHSLPQFRSAGAVRSLVAGSVSALVGFLDLSAVLRLPDCAPPRSSVAVTFQTFCTAFCNSAFPRCFALVCCLSAWLITRLLFTDCTLPLIVRVAFIAVRYGAFGLVGVEFSITTCALLFRLFVYVPVCLLRCCVTYRVSFWSSVPRIFLRCLFGMLDSGIHLPGLPTTVAVAGVVLPFHTRFVRTTCAVPGCCCLRLRSPDLVFRWRYACVSVRCLRVARCRSVMRRFALFYHHWVRCGTGLPLRLPPLPTWVITNVGFFVLLICASDVGWRFIPPRWTAWNSPFRFRILIVL